MHLREYPQAALQCAGHAGDHGAIVRKRHFLIRGTAHPVLNLALGQHTASAVHDHCIARDILRELLSRAELKFQLFPGICPQPARKLHRPDVVALAMMRTAFRDQHGISVLQGAKRCHPGDRCFQKPLVVRHQNRKRCEWNRIRHKAPYQRKCLAVRDDHRSLFPDPFQCR